MTNFVAGLNITVRQALVCFFFFFFFFYSFGELNIQIFDFEVLARMTLSLANYSFFLGFIKSDCHRPFVALILKIKRVIDRVA